MPDLITRFPLPHGELRFPLFLPDATRGMVRAVDAADLEDVGTQALVMNTFHLMQKPGSTTVQALGGLHSMSGWQRPIMTDSGGFQAFSLIRANPKAGSLSAKGFLYTVEGSSRRILLTPEKSIQLQMGYGADILVCLDDCTHPDDPDEKQAEAVERTLQWAGRSKKEFARLCEQKKLTETTRPRLFGVIQGGRSLELRRRCALELLELGFDGFGYGGWPIDEDGALLEDIFAFMRGLVPGNFPMHALGVGHPRSVQTCVKIGYGMCDSALPTRDARSGRLFTTRQDPAAGPLSGDWFAYLYIQDEKHVRADRPISAGCDCPVCARYSLGYLAHLQRSGDALYARLASLHNLRFLNRLMELWMGSYGA